MSEWKERAKPIHTNDPLYWIDRGAWRIAIWNTRASENRFTHYAVLTCFGKEIDHWLGNFAESVSVEEIQTWALEKADKLMGLWNG